MSSGFIAGGAIMGVCLAGLAGAELDSSVNLSSYIGSLAEADWWAMIPFAVMMYALYRIGTAEKNVSKAKPSRGSHRNTEESGLRGFRLFYFGSLR